MTIEKIIDQLDIIKFKYIGQDKYSFGFKALDINELLPKEMYTIVQEDKNGYLMVDYSLITVLLFLYCKELKRLLDDLKNKNKDK